MTGMEKAALGSARLSVRRDMCGLLRDGVFGLHHEDAVVVVGIIIGDHFAGRAWKLGEFFHQLVRIPGAANRLKTWNPVQD